MRIENPALLSYFRFQPRCELCGVESRTGLDPHHAFCKGAGGGGRLDIAVNLIAVCRPCHDAVHAGHISREQVVKTVADREGLLPGDVLGAIHRMRMRPKDYVFDWTAFQNQETA